jgi:hypothetical protein
MMPYGLSISFIIYSILILVLWWDGWVGIFTGLILLGVGYMISIAQQMGFGGFDFNMGSSTHRKPHHRPHAHHQ